MGKQSVDVAGFQEVDVKTNRSRGVDEPFFLRDTLGWPTRSSRFQPGIDLRGGEFGNAILVNLSKPELSYKDEKIQRRRFQKVSGREDRSALAIRLDLKMPPAIDADTKTCGS